MLPILGTPFHYPWLKITSKHTALVSICKHNVGMGGRNYHKQCPSPLFPCNLHHWVTVASTMWVGVGGTTTGMIHPPFFLCN